MIETFIPRASTNIEKVDYDSDEQKMTVTFLGGCTWEYDAVPVGVFQGIQNAASPGSYFFKNVRSVYNGSEV